MYYFESPCRELFGDRIIPLEGDVTDRDKVMSLKELPISTVINCAASVKHFAADSGIEVINVGGAKNIVDLCLATGALMIQTSTISVVEIGYKDRHAISYRERSDFDEAFAKAQSDPGKATMLTSLMAYSYGAGERERKTLIMDREYTLQVLYRLGFTWPLTSWDFFRRFMGVLNGLGYFDEDFEE